MVYDFGLLKTWVKGFIDAFDHCYLLWGKDEQGLVEFIKGLNKRWIEFPFNPTSETLALFLHKNIQAILDGTPFRNGEGDIRVKSVRLHETATGYAETEPDEVLIEQMPLLTEVTFSPGILEENALLSELIKKFGDGKIHN